MRRRGFLSLLVSAAVLRPTPALVQQPGMRRVGLLIGGRGEQDPEAQERLAVVRRTLLDHGWEEGRNLQLILRWAVGDPERIRAYAAELVGLAPEVILANSTLAVGALAKATRTIPIVVAQAVDPVGLGYVQSLARPGGNITGFTFVDFGLVAKWADLLKEAVPTVTRAALLFNPANTPFYPAFLRSVEETRAPGAVVLSAATVGSVAEIEPAVAAVAREPGGALILPPDTFVSINRKLIADLALRYRLPSISVFRRYAAEGGLMFYGPDTLDIFKRATGYVDRILRGANPAELPVQSPSKSEFVVNVSAARALGLEIPPMVLARADEVIE